jgi:hypothetical protein
VHAKPQQGQNYYRLRQVDFDGQSDLSKTIMLFFTGDTQLHTLSLYPNPANSHIRLMIRQTGEVKTTIMDALGRTVHSSVAQGGHEQLIDIRHLPKGRYVVGCEVRGNKMSTTLIVR